jgi:RsiW-degrading membrane proteinase PrsW (M82 family)
MIVFAFLIYGLLSALGALLFELFALSFIVTPSFDDTALVLSTTTLLILACIEEGMKILFFLQALRRFRPASSPLLNGLLFGIGFASLEYFALFFLPLSLPSGPIYGILAIHIFTSLVLARVLQKTPSPQTLFYLFLTITSLHFGYNILL